MYNQKAPCVGCGDCACRLYKVKDPSIGQIVRMCADCKAMFTGVVPTQRTIRFDGRLFTPSSFLDTFVGG